MSRWLLFIIIVYVSYVEGSRNKTFCNGYQANFNLKNIIGSWWVVAIIPEKLFPDNKQITCYKAEFSETDEASLRWLMNKTLDALPTIALEDGMKGTVVRQRYHTKNPFDVWSKSIDNVNGCFKQVISLDIKNKDVHKTINSEAMMQLHLIDSHDGSGPFMLQMLWGKLVSAVIYRRKQAMTQDQLKPVFEFLSKARGPQRLPRICDDPLRDILFENDSYSY
ncbi:hypothetical protein K1T71_012324 [Dendrolimus kikuchii]|uniref:Uncharacterized protein n=1 Tax=Dendrolimus kikuchii TaxID=765133 RepID=A0ACC1CLA7_9NEOP|nr:hypothetical protein K1T71_012324 [Dendrolimus kikuchii]